MKEILKIEVIYNAFMDTILRRLPKKEKDYPEWYKNRLEKCKNCKYNTKNIPVHELPIDLYVSRIIGKDRCSICTCFIKQKAWARTEECAMGETDSRPSWLTNGYIKSDNEETSKWNKLEVITMDEDEFNLVSTDEYKYNIGLSEDGQGFDIKLSPIVKGNNIDFSFIVNSTHDIEVSGIDTSCGCTSQNMSIIGERSIKIDVLINTCGFGVGDFSKHMNLRYYIKGEENEMTIRFNFKGSIE